LKKKIIVLLFKKFTEMKKLVLLLAVVFSVSLFSCGNADKNAAAADSTADTTQVDSAATDSAATDSAAAPADSAAAPADSAAAQK